MQNILKTTLNIRPALIETPELLWNNLAPSASPLLALGSDLSNKGSGAALPSDTKSEQLLRDCANRLISFSIVGCCSRAKLKIYATSKLWREDSKFSLPQKKHKSEMYTPYFFLWETLVQALNRALLFKYGSHLVTRWLLVCNTFWGVRKNSQFANFSLHALLFWFGLSLLEQSWSRFKHQLFSLHQVNFYARCILHLSCDGSSKQNLKFTKQIVCTFKIPYSSILSWCCMSLGKVKHVHWKNFEYFTI